MVVGFILSISIARLLLGGVKLIQHPGRTRPYWIHLLWALYIFFVLIHFWWSEYSLKTIKQCPAHEHFVKGVCTPYIEWPTMMLTPPPAKAKG